MAQVGKVFCLWNYWGLPLLRKYSLEIATFGCRWSFPRTKRCQRFFLTVLERDNLFAWYWKSSHYSVLNCHKIPSSLTSWLLNVDLSQFPLQRNRVKTVLTRKCQNNVVNHLSFFTTLQILNQTIPCFRSSLLVLADLKCHMMKGDQIKTTRTKNTLGGKLFFLQPKSPMLLCLLYFCKLRFINLKTKTNWLSVMLKFRSNRTK